MASHFIISVPLDPKSSRTPIERFKSSMVETSGRSDLAELRSFAIPQLRVGSLDSLVTLTDELARLDAYVEGVFKKAERLVTESHLSLAALKFLEGKPLGTDTSSMPTPKAQPFYFNGKQVWDYLNSDKCLWASDEFDIKESLPNIARRIQSGAEKCDQELRNCSQACQEKKTAQQAAERKKGGNFLVAPLEDIITPKSLQSANAEWVSSESSEFLSSVVLVIPLSGEEVFLTSYHSLDDKSVPLGPEGAREKTRGSPVVPKSARRIAQDSEGYVIYTLIVLKPFLDSFRTAAKERRWVVRDFQYVPGLAGSGERSLKELARDTESVLLVAKDSSRRIYETSLSLLIHVKMLRVHVDSVLRYGLPVNYSATLFIPAKGETGRAFQSVREAWKAIAGASGEFDAMYAPAPLKPKDDDDDQAVGPDPVIPGVTDGSGAGGGEGGALPFVFFEFDIKQNTEQVIGSLAR